MRTIQLTLISSLVMTMMACSHKTNAPKAFDTNNLDTTVAPGVDFYQYACGGWMKNNPLKPEFSRFGTFDQLAEENEKQLRDLIEELGKEKHAPGTVAQKIGTIFSQAMDSVKLNQEGGQSITATWDEVQSINNKEQLATQFALLVKKGISLPFNFYIYADDMNSNMNIVHVTQGGLSLPDRDYYFAKDEKSVVIRDKFKQYVVDLFNLYRPKEATNATAGEKILAIETNLAQTHFTKEALRDPMANYHKLTMAELSKRAPGFDWNAFFNGLGIRDLKDLNVAQVEPIVTAAQWIGKAPIEDIKLYLSWNLLNSATSFLSDDYQKLSFDFYGKTLTGAEEDRPRWKRAVNVADGVLGEAVGELYVKKYFPESSKEKMLKLVGNLKEALGERIQSLPWMTDSTKTKALEKLAAFHVKIGYPDKWRDYSKLEISDKVSYFENILRARVFEYDYMLSKVNKPVDKDEWGMTPQTVNAYYNPTTNEICFPAAILQPPFFNAEADDAINYGAIGVVIGHEMTHGFDDQGRMFDKDGNLSEWWNAKDAEQFNARTAGLVKQYDNIVVIDTLHANGTFTLGENIADQGGLQVSFQAFQKALKSVPNKEKIDGFTPEQRFFLSYATVWASNIRNEEIIRLTKIDPHSLCKWRVNGALPNIDAWYDAFGIKEGDPMFLPKDKRVVIW